MLDKITLPPMISRYELKYLISRDMIERISDFISPYCSMDYHSAQTDDHFYTVNSLYLDTCNCEFLKNRLYGKDNRFNMRVRSYGDGKDKPQTYYLEIKNKVGTGVKKYRTTIHSGEWPDILTATYCRSYEMDKEHEKMNKDLFIRLASAYSIEPKIFTQYQRLAFFSTVDEYARITMDCNMRYRDQSFGTSSGDHYSMESDDTMINYDNETIYGDGVADAANVILELKCNIGQVPTWMMDIVTRFELKQVGFSKYVSSSMVSARDNGIHYMESDKILSADIMS